MTSARLLGFGLLGEVVGVETLHAVRQRQSFLLDLQALAMSARVASSTSCVTFAVLLSAAVDHQLALLARLCQRRLDVESGGLVAQGSPGGLDRSLPSIAHLSLEVRRGAIGGLFDLLFVLSSSEVAGGTGRNEGLVVAGAPILTLCSTSRSRRACHIGSIRIEGGLDVPLGAWVPILVARYFEVRCQRRRMPTLILMQRRSSRRANHHQLIRIKTSTVADLTSQVERVVVWESALPVAEVPRRFLIRQVRVPCTRSNEITLSISSGANVESSHDSRHRRWFVDSRTQEEVAILQVVMLSVLTRRLLLEFIIRLGLLSDLGEDIVVVH